MSTRQSTTPATVPTVHIHHERERRRVMITRGEEPPEPIATVDTWGDAERLASYLRGALADAYSAGRADQRAEHDAAADDHDDAVREQMVSIYDLGYDEGLSAFGMTYDDDSTSPRSRIYDRGRAARQAEAGFGRPAMTLGAMMPDPGEVPMYEARYEEPWDDD
jgi:hypothetical protein